MKIGLAFGSHYDAVTVDGKPLTPERSLRVFPHSPDGFSWGYGGSGPSQLALAILLEAGCSDEQAVRLHQQFKADFVARWAHDGPGDAQVHEIDVARWIALQGRSPDAA